MTDKQVYATPMNQGRAMVYRLLSSLFAKELDQQLLHELTSSQAQAFFAQLASDPLLAQDIASLNSVLNTLNTDRALLELAADYCGLFLVGTKHSASPYASLYLGDNDASDEILLFGEQHQQMKTFLQQSHLTEHSYRIHPGEKQYSCDTCDKAFHTNSELTKHIKIRME